MKLRRSEAIGMLSSGIVIGYASRKVMIQQLAKGTATYTMAEVRKLEENIKKLEAEVQKLKLGA